MNLLVTGGAGFIGSNFVRRILSLYPYKVVVYDKLTYAGLLSRLEELKDLYQGRFSFVHGDICDAQRLDETVKDFRIEAVINFAAESHVDRSLIHPYAFAETDVLGTTVLLDVSRNRGIQHFVQVSTDEVYGEVSFGSVDEAGPLCPRNPYAASKAGAEMMAMACYASYGLPVSITRSSNNYGPWQHPEKFLARSITRLVQGETIQLHGSGMHVRDWIYVEDNCAALDVVLHRGAKGEIYNICAGELHTNRHMAELLLTLLELPDDRIELVPDRPGNDRRYAMANLRIRNLGWAPTVSLSEGLVRTINWYRENRQWWLPMYQELVRESQRGSVG